MADGRDLLLHIIPKKEEDWRPSMTLIDIIQQIPAFISEQIKATKEGTLQAITVGKFHLGLQYDISVWQQDPACGIFPC